MGDTERYASTFVVMMSFEKKMVAVHAAATYCYPAACFVFVNLFFVLIFIPSLGLWACF
jgi:hypothetical protein